MKSPRPIKTPRDVTYSHAYAKIYTQENDVRPQFFSEAIVHELRTYQAKTGMKLMNLWRKNRILLFICGSLTTRR